MTWRILPCVAIASLPLNLLVGGHRTPLDPNP